MKNRKQTTRKWMKKIEKEKETLNATMPHAAEV